MFYGPMPIKIVSLCLFQPKFLHMRISHMRYKKIFENIAAKVFIKIE